MNPVTDLNLLRHARLARHPEQALRAAGTAAPRRRPTPAGLLGLLRRLLRGMRRPV